MAQGMSTNHKGDSPAGRVMSEAIELDIEGRSPYPKRASFIDADASYVGEEIRRSVEEDMAIVLVEADGSTLILRAEPVAHDRHPRLSAGMRSILKTLRISARARPRSLRT
jgi:hypothetical protein